ncbi:MAG: PLP-dependent aminotransferase family protein [Clostridiales bacterium]|nr:PLP-dependent aminotransferase family protein [Clostridiales bacterium]
MKYVIDPLQKQSAYLQLYRQLRSDITDGVYKHGQRLPSKRLLADETETSVITVQHAYDLLCEEGYAQARQRSGYYVTYRPADFVPVWERSGAGDSELAGPQPANSTQIEAVKPLETSLHSADEFPFSVFARTMRTVISKYGDRILIKCPNQGSPELRRALSDYLARSKGMRVTPEQIVIGSGAEYLYSLIAQLLGREKIYAVEDPSYEKIRAVYKGHGIRCDYLTMGNDGILSSELERTAARVLHVTPFHSFPTGVTASASKRSEYLHWAKDRDAVIIEDDFDSEFTVSTKHEDTLFSLEPHRSVIYVNTFTRTIAPSMRIGYMILPSELTGLFQERVGVYSCTVPVFEQYVLAEFIANGDFERHINRVRRKRRQALNPRP